MKSIKPGRGPSAMGAVGAVVGVGFGILWTAMAVSMGAPIFFPLFGILFIGMGIAQAVYHFKNATGKNRYSAFDITEEGEEPDPLNQYFGQGETQAPSPEEGEIRFCPYCGAKLQGENFAFCPQCGQELPEKRD